LRSSPLLKQELGDLDRVTKWLRAVGYVQTAPDFHDNALVVNGFSDLIVEIWGDVGRHARSAPGQGPSPLNVPIIVDAIVAVSGLSRVGAFDELEAIPPQLLADGYLARAVHGERLTFAVVEVEPGAELPEHHHDNEQFGMVIEGSVIFRVGDDERGSCLSSWVRR